MIGKTMSDLRIKANIDCGDLSRDMRNSDGDKIFDFRTKEMKDAMEEKPKLEPITLGKFKIELKDVFNPTVLRKWFEKVNGQENKDKENA